MGIPSDTLGRQVAHCATLEYILLGDLRDLLEEPPDEQNRKWLRAVLDALLDTLPREFRLRDRDGYLEDVLERYPNWYSQVERLHDEQHELFDRLHELRMRLERAASFADVAEELRRDLRHWMKSLTAHHRHERRITQEAFNLDVGTGD